MSSVYEQLEYEIAVSKKRIELLKMGNLQRELAESSDTISQLIGKVEKRGAQIDRLLKQDNSFERQQRLEAFRQRLTSLRESQKARHMTPRQMRREMQAEQTRLERLQVLYLPIHQRFEAIDKLFQQIAALQLTIDTAERDESVDIADLVLQQTDKLVKIKTVHMPAITELERAAGPQLDAILSGTSQTKSSGLPGGRPVHRSPTHSFMRQRVKQRPLSPASDASEMQVDFKSIKQQFIDAYRLRLAKDKAWGCGIYSFFATSYANVDEDESLESIVNHALGKNASWGGWVSTGQRSFEVLKDLRNSDEPPLVYIDDKGHPRASTELQEAIIAERIAPPAIILE